MTDDAELERIRMKKLMELQKRAQQQAQWPAGVVHTLTLSDFDKFIKSAKIVIIDYYADWCQPCKIMAPIMEQLAKEWASKDVRFGKINIDDYPPIAMRYGIQSIPFFMIFKDGKPFKNTLGAVGKAPFANFLKSFFNV